MPRDPFTFGRKPYRRTPEQLANKRGAIGFAGMFVVMLALAFALNQPVFAIAAFIFLVTAVIIAKDA